MALAAVEAEALAIAPLHAWGLVLPVDDGLVSYQMSHPWGTHVNILPPADLPPGLRTPIFGVRQITPGENHSAIEAAYATLGVGALVAIPMPGDSGLFWAGTASNEPLSDAQVAALGTLAKRHRRARARARVRRRARGPARAPRIALRRAAADCARARSARCLRAPVRHRPPRPPARHLRRRHPQRGSHAGAAARAERRSVARRPAGSRAEPVSEGAGGQPGVRDHPRPGLAPVRAGRDRRAARPAVGAAAAAVARRTAQGRARLQQRRAGALHRNRSAGRAAHRRLHHAGAVAQGDRGPGAARGDAGRARRQPQRARRAAVDAHRCARRAPGRRSRVGDRADGAAARRAVDPAARGRRSRPRLREQRPWRRARRRTRR